MGNGLGIRGTVVIIPAPRLAQEHTQFATNGYGELFSWDMVAVA